VKSFFWYVMVLPLVVAGCSEQRSQASIGPQKLTSDAVGHYCGMTLTEHSGPKGQIILESRKDPVWFSSARDAVSFTMLAEEAKDIRAIYVSDMAKAPTWSDPGAENWIDAHHAFFVIGSRKQGGMGAPETVPFSSRAAAETFIAEHGGKIVAFAEVPRDYVLSSEPATEEVGGKEHHNHDVGATQGAQ
jgi:copper chaperone NosL